MLRAQILGTDSCASSKALGHSIQLQLQLSLRSFSSALRAAAYLEPSLLGFMPITLQAHAPPFHRRIT